LSAAVVLVLLAMLALAPQARAAASWSFDPGSWDFGTVTPGDGPTPPKAFTLTNTGDVELSVVFVSVAGSEGAGFSIAENKCGKKLAPATSCTISVSFNPSSAGPKDGELGVASQGGLAPPASAELSGAGAGPVVSIAPAALSFEPRDVGAGPSPAKSFTLANDGALGLTISSVCICVYRYSDTDQFHITGGTCAAGLVVEPEESCTLEVAFAPTRPGSRVADLLVVSDAPDSPHLATLEGFGIAPPAQFLGSPPFINPLVSLVHRPPRRTSKRRAAFWFRGSPSAARFACRLDAPEFKICESPIRYSALRLGRHHFAVRALDANNRFGSITHFRWFVKSPDRGSRSSPDPVE
jgi:hypothetical protein